MIIQNAFQCPDGTYLVSLSRHDYKVHNEFMVDGGQDYYRGNEINKAAVDLYLDKESTIEEICNKLICEEAGKPWREIKSKQEIQNYRKRILDDWQRVENHGFHSHTRNHAFLHLYVSGYWIVQYHKNGVLITND